MTGNGAYQMFCQISRHAQFRGGLSTGLIFMNADILWASLGVEGRSDSGSVQNCATFT